MKTQDLSRWIKWKPFLGFLLLTPMIFLFQNCGKGFELKENFDSVSLGSLADPGNQDQPKNPGDPVPGDMDPMLRLKSLSYSGFMSSCGIDLKDQIYCWAASKPLLQGKISGAIEVIQISQGQCVLSSTGKVHCRELYVDGKAVTEPGGFSEIQGLSNVTHIYGSAMRYCAHTSNQKVFCWPNFKFASQTGPDPSLAEVTDMAGLKSIGMTLAHLCGVDSNEKLKCRLMMANGGSAKVFPELSNLVEVHGTGTHQTEICTLDKSGNIECGSLEQNSAGELILDLKPSPFLGMGPFKMLTISGFSSICAVRMDDKIYCAGDNHYFQVNNSSQTTFPTAVEVMTLPVRQIRSYWGTTCVLAMDYAVRCWGSSEHSGDDDLHTSTRGINIAELQNVKQLDTMGEVPLRGAPFLLMNDGSLHCTAHYDPSYVGEGSSDSDLSELCPASATDGFVPFRGLAGVKQISGNSGHMCGLLNNGQITCWGWKSASFPNGKSGAMGNRVASPLSPFGVVSGVENAIQVLALRNATCALLADGRVVCWGALGDQPAMANPTAMTDMTNIKNLVAYSYGFCALGNSGGVTCLYGHYGDGIPVVVPVTGIQQLGAYGHKIVGLKADGSSVEWNPGGSSEPYYVPNPVSGFASIQKLYSARATRQKDVLCGLNMMGQNICLNAHYNSTPDISLTNTNLDEYTFGPGYICRLGTGPGFCYGSRPFHSAKDLLSKGILK